MITELITAYILGFIFNVAFFSMLGKTIGFDYSGPKDYANCDDWDNNAQAYTAFSMMWPVTDSLLILWGVWIILTKLTGIFIKS